MRGKAHEGDEFGIPGVVSELLKFLTNDIIYL